jgi:hypothetical protein
MPPVISGRLVHDFEDLDRRRRRVALFRPVAHVRTHLAPLIETQAEVLGGFQTVLDF